MIFVTPLFADDLKTYCGVKNTEDCKLLQYDMDFLQKWSADNGIVTCSDCLYLWEVVYVYIETTTYRSDSQAFIVCTCYTDVFTAGRK
jgi:hypothetical protein